MRAHLQRIRIQRRAQIGLAARLGAREQPVIQTHFGRGRVGGVDPVNHALDPSAGRLRAAARVRIILAAHFQRFAMRVAAHAGAAHHERVAQAHRAPRREAVKFFRRRFGKIIALNKNLPRNSQFARSHAFVGRVVGRVNGFAFAFRVIFNDQFQRPQHRHRARRARLQILARAVFQQAHVGDVVLARNPGQFHELANRGRRKPAPPQPRQRRHARIVPAGDIAALHQLRQHALAGHGVI